MKRRHFLKSATLVATAAPLILTKMRVFGADAPSNKVNIALLGAHGRGSQHYDILVTQNIVAICDVDEKHRDLANQRFPAAKRYIDWRECLGHPGLDAVFICTPDHMHAMITMWAMNRGLHVYCEK